MLSTLIPDLLAEQPLVIENSDRLPTLAIIHSAAVDSHTVDILLVVDTAPFMINIVPNMSKFYRRTPDIVITQICFDYLELLFLIIWYSFVVKSIFKIFVDNV